MENSTALLAPTATVTPDEMAARTFLARYPEGTRTTYGYALKKLFAWCAEQGLRPLEMKRPILELFVRWMEEQGTARSTVAQQVGVIRGYYKMAAIDEYIPRSPAEHLRVPKAWDDEGALVGLDRSELMALMQTAKAENPTEWALVALMGMAGLRVSEACSIRIEDFAQTLTGHRVLRFVGKGSKPATIPIPVQLQRALDAAAGDRTEGLLLVRQTGQRKGAPHTRTSVPPVIKRLARKAGITKHVHPHMLRHAYVAAGLDAGVPLREMQIAARHADPRTTARYDRARHNLDRHGIHMVAAYLAGAG